MDKEITNFLKGIKELGVGFRSVKATPRTGKIGKKIIPNIQKGGGGKGCPRMG